MSIEVGHPTPGFTLEDKSGEMVSLEDFAGQNVILYFFPRAESPACSKEAAAFRDVSRKLNKLDTIVVGISSDDPRTLKKFTKKFKLPFTLLSDPDRKTMAAYGAFGEKMMYGKSTVGVIRSTFWIGPDGRVVKHWKRISKAGDHPPIVFQAVAAAAAEAAED
ncbi:MAG: peroxiredoxin Q/BCP [Pseudohongiellaceae bacterium]|jgi:peroxiredoxin Q/BCP